MNRQLDKILDWRNQKNGKYNFEQRCLFPEQLTYKMYREGNKQFAYVPMQSGRTGLYEVHTERCDYGADDTGQRHWKFIFIRFLAQKEV
jgi:hypothetical protein